MQKQKEKHTQNGNKLRLCNEGGYPSVKAELIQNSRTLLMGNYLKKGSVYYLEQDNPEQEFLTQVLELQNIKSGSPKSQSNLFCQKNNIYKIQQTKNSMNNQKKEVVIGSYPYRGNVNICRLLCQYVDMPYENLFFNPCTWKSYKEKYGEQWYFQELPFLLDGDFVVTQSSAMCEYIIKKSQRYELLGKTPEDALMVDTFLWGKDLIQNVLSLVVEHKNDPKRLMQQMHSSWMKTIRAQLLEYEKNAQQGQFYLGYISVIDFILHEIFEYYKSIFRKEINLFPKLLAIREKVASMQKVKKFEKSDRTVTEMCPLQFYRKWKIQAMKNSSNRSSSGQGENLV